MCASVEHKRNEERPFFQSRSKPIEPSFDKWTKDSSIERELEKAFSKNFNHSDGDLFYFRIYQSSENKTIIRGSYSHVPYDGTSGLILLNDLLQFAADENYTREPHPVVPQVSELIGASDWKYTSRPETLMEFSDFTKNPDAIEYRPQVRCRKFSKEITTALIEQAHSHGVSVHAILTGNSIYDHLIHTNRCICSMYFNFTTIWYVSSYQSSSTIGSYRSMSLFTPCISIL